MSNSKEVLESADVEDTVQVKDSNLHKPLGIFWNVESDQLHFPLDFDHCKMTRRGLLSNLAKFYDPIGVISPLIHQAKLLLHQMCQQKYGWDDCLSGELLSGYEKWRDLLGMIGEVDIPRCVRLRVIICCPSRCTTLQTLVPRDMLHVHISDSWIKLVESMWFLCWENAE